MHSPHFKIHRELTVFSKQEREGGKKEKTPLQTRVQERNETRETGTSAELTELSFRHLEFRNQRGRARRYAKSRKIQREQETD